MPVLPRANARFRREKHRYHVDVYASPEKATHPQAVDVSDEQAIVQQIKRPGHNQRSKQYLTESLSQLNLAELLVQHKKEKTAVCQ